MMVPLGVTGAREPLLDRRLRFILCVTGAPEPLLDRRPRFQE